MKKIIFIISILTISLGLKSQTVVSGNITGIWESSGNPFIVVGNINVVDSLFIEPGVIVQFQAGGWQIEVGAGDRFFANGNDEYPIVFEPYQGVEPGSWDQIYFNESGNDDTVSHCIVRYGTTGIYAYNCGPLIRNSIINGNLEHGIFFRSYVGSYEAKVSDCIVHDNFVAGIVVQGYDRYGTASMIVTIDHCLIFNNLQDGILSASGTWWAVGNAYSLADINNCLVVNNYDGIKAGAHRGSANAKLTNTIIAFNSGFGIVNDETHSFISAEDLIYNCIWDNMGGDFSGIDIPTGFGLNGDYQNYNEDSCDINFNIYNDPLFVDAFNANFSLQQSSKCIDAGTNIVLGEVVYDPDGTIPDIGPNYFDQSGIWITENVAGSLNVYPNPFSNKTTIEFDNPNQSNYYLSIFNLSGHQVFERKNIKSDKIEIKRNDLPNGIYFIELISDKSKFSEKIIIK